MNRIYQCEDSIEQTKFLLAALKIENAFQTLHNISQRKELSHYQTFLFQLRRANNKQILRGCQQPFLKLAETLQKITANKKRSTFFTLFFVAEKEERKSHHNSKESENYNHSHNLEPPLVKSVSVIEEENWREKMTIEELQNTCDYYAMKIREVQRSFSDFFHVIKNE